MTPHRLRDVIGASMIGAFVGAVFVLFWKVIPASNEQIITYMIGQLSGFAGTIIAYHYASNVNSHRASESQAKAVDALAGQAGTTSTGRMDVKAEEVVVEQAP